MRFLSDKTRVMITPPCASSLLLLNFSFLIVCFSWIAGKDDQDFYEIIPIIIRELVYRLNDDNPEVLKAAHNAFMALSTHVPAEELVKHVEYMKNLLASMVSDARRRKGGVGDGEFLLPGFNIPKGKLLVATYAK
jgi:hypothetical protein